MNSVKSLAALVVLLTGASGALADFDVSPAVSGGKIVTNATSDATGQFVHNVRVFDFAFDDPSTPFFTQDPGFHTIAPSGFAPNVGLTVSPAGPLTYWSGTGSPAFVAVPGGESLRLDFGTTMATITGAGPAGSVFIGSTDASGDLHEHIESTLFAPAGQTPADGVYLVPLKLMSPSYNDSQTFFALYNNGGLDDSAIARAVQFVHDTQAPDSNIAPEPSGPVAVGIGLAGILRRKRSCRAE